MTKTEEKRKERKELARKVIELTNLGLYVYEIARTLHITEAEVVRLQGR